MNAAESNRSRRPNGGAARAERFHIPLLLCCAEDNEVGLVKVVDALHREGMAPEVVPGVELDPAVLGEAVDRTDGPALFVLCQTDELEKAAIRRLTGLFSARRGPGQQLVTVSLNAAHPLAVLPTIRKAMKEVARLQYEPGDVEPDDSARLTHMRDVVGPTPVSATVKRPAVDPEALARELHEGMLEAEALLDRRSRSSTPSPKPAPKPPRREAPPRPVVASRDAGVPRAALDIDEPVERPLVEPPSSRSSSSQTPTLDDLDPEQSGDMAAERALPRAREAPRTDESGPPHRLMFVAAIVGVAALGVVAVVQMMAGDDDGRQPPARSVPVASAPAEPSRPAESPSPTRSAKAPEKALAASPDGDEATPTETDDDLDVQEEAEAAPGARSSRDHPIPPPPPDRVDGDAGAIEQALASGKIKAAGNLLVAFAGTETTTWDLADSQCKDHKVDALRKWRLPSRAQLRTLMKAGGLPHGTYWSRENTDAGDEAYALDTGSGQVNVYLTMEAVARTVCVRNR